jgi:hypothetical protein
MEGRRIRGREAGRMLRLVGGEEQGGLCGEAKWV